MPAPRPGAVTLLIVNASVAGKYAYCVVFFIFIYPHDKHKLHSRLTKREKREEKKNMTHRCLLKKKKRKSHLAFIN